MVSFLEKVGKEKEKEEEHAPVLFFSYDSGGRGETKRREGKGKKPDRWSFCFSPILLPSTPGGGKGGKKKREGRKREDATAPRRASLQVLLIRPGVIQGRKREEEEKGEGKGAAAAGRPAYP